MATTDPLTSLPCEPIDLLNNSRAHENDDNTNGNGTPLHIFFNINGSGDESDENGSVYESDDNGSVYEYDESDEDGSGDESDDNGSGFGSGDEYDNGSGDEYDSTQCG